MIDWRSWIRWRSRSWNEVNSRMLPSCKIPLEKEGEMPRMRISHQPVHDFSAVCKVRDAMAPLHDFGPKAVLDTKLANVQHASENHENELPSKRLNLPFFGVN